MSQEKEYHPLKKPGSRRTPPSVKIEHHLGEEMAVALCVDPAKRKFMLWCKDADRELQLFFPEKRLWMFEAMFTGASESMKGARSAARKKNLRRAPKSKTAPKKRNPPSDT